MRCFMTRRTLKTALWSILSMVIIAGTAGCSGGPGSPEANGEPQSAAPEPVELVFYSCGNTTEEVFDVLYGDAIRKKYPQFKLRYISGLSASKASELMPKMLMENTVDINFDSIGNIPSCLLMFDLQKDMSDLIKKHKLDLNKLEPRAVQGMKDLAGGGMYGIPVFNNTRVLYYNKDLFDKFGVAYPKDGMTWDEANALARRMTRSENGVIYLGMTASEQHQIRLNALSVPILDPKTGKPTINTDERWRTILTKGFFDPFNNELARQSISKAFPTINQFVKEKRVAMMPNLANLPADQQPLMKEVNWDMVTEPTYAEAPKTSSSVYPTYFSITSQSKHREEAMLAIEVLVTEEHQAFLSRLGQVPVLQNEEIRKMLGQGSEFKDKNWGAVFLHTPAAMPYKSKYDNEIEVIYRKQILSYAQGQVDLNTLLRNAEEEANKYLEAAKR